ncbi:MoaD/ThiS family protein [Novosphingobium sp.]|uniref:MoaD/ThiS family protein n=1 Tax=Novosphingobium sp. TaxID=1874826 RepID=UPI0038B7B221
MCGRFAELARDVIDFPVSPDGETIAYVMGRLVQAFPGLAEPLRGPRVKACLDEAIVPFDALACPGQVLAFFPPVSGG